MADVVDLDSRRGSEPPAPMTCGRCGCVWLRPAGMTADADSGSATGYAYPLTCTECAAVLTRPVDIGGTWAGGLS